MKRVLISFLFFNSVIIAQSKEITSPIFNAPDLGKTHFIIGLQPEKVVHEQRVKECGQETNLCELLRCKDGSFKQAFFSPDDNIQNLLIKLIDNEQMSIKLAIFSFTDGEIAQALMRAQARGVHIEVVTDISSVRDRFNKIDLLKKNRVTVHVYNPKNTSLLNDIMHNKFILFGKNVGGKSLLWTGSFNFTKSAKMNNQENVVILDEIQLIDRFNKQFAVIKERIYKKEPIRLAQKKKRFITTIPS